MRWKGPFAGRVALALTVALAAGVAVSPRAGAQKSTKDTLSVVAAVHQATLDPHFAITTQDLIFNRNIYNALIKFKPNSIEFEPELATSWTVSRDGGHRVTGRAVRALARAAEARREANPARGADGHPPKERACA